MSTQSSSFLNRRLEYMEGKQTTVGRLIFFIAAAFGGLWVYNNSDDLLKFVNNLTSIGEQIIYGGLLVGVIWIAWTILTHPKFAQLVSRIIDGSIYGLIKFYKERNPIRAARFDLDRLAGRIEEFVWAHAEVEAAAKIVTEAYKRSKQEADSHTNTASGLHKALDKSALQLRQSGKEPEKDPGYQLKMSQYNSFLSRRSTALKFAEGYKAKMEALATRLSRISLIADKLRIDQQEGEDYLRQLALSLQVEQANERGMAAAYQALQGEEKQMFEDSLNMIREKIAQSAARADVLYSMIEPDINAFQAKQEMATIQNQEEFENYLVENGFMTKSESTLNTMPNTAFNPDLQSANADTPKPQNRTRRLE